MKNLFSRFKNRSDSNTPETPTDKTGDSPSEIAIEANNKTWMQRLRSGLSKTSKHLQTLFSGHQLSDEWYEELETALLMADVGVDASTRLLEELQKKVKENKLTDLSLVKQTLRTILIEWLSPLERSFLQQTHRPNVVMIAGVNGAGKTTSIGKLTHYCQQQKLSVLLSASDTFRAAATEQLAIWAERNQVHVISQQNGDPAAIAFDAVQAATARNIDVVFVDTAGRLPTQLHLMEELKKIQRVLGKANSDAPHETLLILDGSMGQNALAQIKAFDDALQLTGLIITKLDGTAKGGIVVALAAGIKHRPIPVYFVGLGEGIYDMQPFSAQEYANALLGDL